MTSGSTKRHMLNLREKQGFLDETLIDFPLINRIETHYLRQKNTWQIPASYRSGLALFALVMILSVFGITAMDAQTLAESHRDFLNARLVREFSEVDLGVGSVGTVGSVGSVGSVGTVGSVGSVGSVGTGGFVNPLERQAQLVSMGMEVKKGYEYFQEFLNTWKDEDSTLMERMDWMKNSAEKSLKVWEGIMAQLEGFPFYELEADKRSELNKSIAVISGLKEFLEGFVNNYEALASALGDENPQRILVFAQDPNELRASGGALSAGLEILVEDGEILTWKPFHVSEFESANPRLTPPRELASISDNWNLATANSYLDFPKTAEKISWFWQRQARSTADLIVFLDTGFFEELQKVMPFSNDLANISLRWTSLRLEDNREALKTLLSVSLQEFFGQMKTPEGFFRILPVLAEQKNSKGLMARSNHPEIQKSILALNIDGSLPPTGGREDFLMVSRVNTEDNASDRWISEKHRLTTDVSPEGHIRNTLLIQSSHRWENSYISPLLDKIGKKITGATLKKLTTAANNSYMRVLAPKGSKLLSAAGIALSDIKINETDTNVVWSYRSTLAPGALSEIVLTYELPWIFETKTVDNYRLNIVKQAGTPSVEFAHELNFPKNMKVYQQLPEEPIIRLEKDERIAVVAGKS